MYIKYTKLYSILFFSVLLEGNTFLALFDQLIHFGTLTISNRIHVIQETLNPIRSGGGL